MADDHDYAAALNALLTALRTPDEAGRNLSWLANGILEELQRAESEARSAWTADTADSVAEPDSVLADRDQFEIALRVMYHHLVSVPRMWAYVQEFWRARRQARVFVIDSTRQERIDLSDDIAIHTANTALSFIRRLIATLTQEYGLTLSEMRWLPAEEDGHGQ